MYGIDGRTELPERELPHLEGYEGSAPVRIGNAASDQLQLDIYGALIDSIYLYDKWGQPISSEEWDEVCGLVDWVCEHWDQPDEGIWETRGGRKSFLYSRLMCWVAIERAMRTAHRRGLPADLPAGAAPATRSTGGSCSAAGPPSGRRSCSTRTTTSWTRRS
ncbi:glycoside hydrolase family 15 protein [Thermocatellispora tengchongensis]|uniref:glycoside hydrolase family 15 protein n=1 Tax=Thermocatellispora tengchongensis TaxID=1073253 RepID=UPI0036401088